MAEATNILEALRERVVGEEFDHQTLLDSVKGYARPRDAITRLLRSGSVIRVAPGIYTFGPAYRRRPFSREILANLIAGPSYISFDYALQHHGLIPERAREKTMSGVPGRPFTWILYLKPRLQSAERSLSSMREFFDRTYRIVFRRSPTGTRSSGGFCTPTTSRDVIILELAPDGKMHLGAVVVSACHQPLSASPLEALTS